MYIDKIWKLDELLEYERYILKERNIKVSNISRWHTSDEYQNYMSKYIILDYTGDIFNYKYTYNIPYVDRNKIIKKITKKDNTDSLMCLITPSSTCSITNMINFLKLNNFRKLCILAPSYFSVEQNCKIFNLPYEKIYLEYVNEKYILPIEKIIANDFDAIWLTSPIYSTGILYEKSQIEVISQLMKRQILVIADETLALPGQELSRIIPISDYFYSIYSPHKSLFINSIKFSIILCPAKNDDFLEQWIDVLGGGLLHSNIMAIYHFLSSNYQDCLEYCIKWYNQGISAIKDILKLSHIAYCDTSTLSPYKTIYLDKTKKNPSDFKNIKELITKEYVSYIPGSLNDFGEKSKCFRINLSLNPFEIKNILYRVLKYYT